MARRLRCLVAGTVLLVLFTASAALAADPATVSVRVEGDADTLVARTSLAATGAAVVRGGNSCPGNSAAAALERVTAGDWSGTWNAGFSDWELTSIKGETHSFTAPAYWGFFVNEAPASLGICGQQVQAGDRLLFAPASSTSFDPLGILTLEGVPAAAVPGTPFTVTVKRTTTGFGGPPDYLPVVETLPLQGATIALPGGGTATTGADGKAAITLPAGPATLRAVRAGDVRSATEAVCASTGSDGLCGTVRPGGGTTTPAAVAADATPAPAKVAGIREAQRFKKGVAPRTLSGTVASDASGIKDVLLRLTRKVRARGKAKARCEAYDGRAERWVRSSPCGTEGGTFFSIGSKTAWSYLLPSALTAARYVLDIRTVDGAGNVTRGADRGSDPSKPRTRVVFTVG